jgi:hypothetical protein
MIIWALVPYLEGMDQLNSLPFFALFEFSLYAIKSKQELEGILRAVRFIDGYSWRFPDKDKELRQTMTNDINIMIGRNCFPS